MKEKGFLLTIALLATLGAPAAAQQCFGRYYTPEHMSEHPDQTVEEIFFGTLRGDPILQVRLKTDDDYGWGEAKCEVGGGDLVCTLARGSGAFVIRDQGDGTVLLGLLPNGVILRDGQTPVTVNPRQSDDSRFVLYPGKGCLN